MSIEAESAFRRSPDAEPWRLCLYDRDGNILGAGIALADGAVLTCAHVIMKAVDFTEPAETVVTVEWVGRPTAGRRAARVRADCWAPPRPDHTGDIALLDIDDSEGDELPGTLLSRLHYPRNRLVHAYGFPPPLKFGSVATATLAGTGGPHDEWVQLDPTERGGRIRPGFSGGGVVDDRTGLVVGMVVMTYQDHEATLAWLIPVDTLVKHVPAIEDQIGPDVPRDPWQPSYGAIEIAKPGAIGGQVVDASGRSTDDMVRSLPPRTQRMELGFAGLDRAQEPEKVLDDVVAPLVRSGMTVVLEFEDDSSPTAELARQWQRDALYARVDSLAEGVAELTDREREVTDERARVRARFVTDLPEIPALAAELALPMMGLRSYVRDAEPTRLARALHRYERKLVQSLKTVVDAGAQNDALTAQHEQQRGLLDSYHAKAAAHGLAEDPRLVELYAAARAAVDARPCELTAATQSVDAYVAEVRRRT